MKMQDLMYTSRMAGWALRTFKTRLTLVSNADTSENVSCSQSPILLPTLELSRFSQYQSSRSVQQRFTSRCSAFQTYDINIRMPICTVRYEDRLKCLKIYGLERRRECFMILYIYKTITELVPKNQGTANLLDQQLHGRK